MFTNLRMRLKLAQHSKLVTPENVEEKVQTSSRLQRFFNFFKFQRPLKRRRSRKVAPLTLAKGKKENLALQMNKDDQVTKIALDGEQNLPREDNKDELVDNEVSKSEIEDDLQSEDGESIDMEIKAIFDNDKISSERSKQKIDASVQNNNETQKDLFERIDKKIASKSKNPRRLAPIIGGAKPNQQPQVNVEYSVFGNKFYRGDLLFPQGKQQQLPPRPVTPSLCKDPLVTRELLSEADLTQKQIKADELRNETVMKKLQLTSARRYRYEKRRTELVEENKTKIELRNERDKKVVENKMKMDAEKVEVGFY